MSVLVGGEIVTDGLILHYDALNGKSYPGSGTTWYDLTPNNTAGDLNNGNNPVTIANGYASFVSDTHVSNDRFMTITSISDITNEYVTVDMWAKLPYDLSNDANAYNPYLFGFSTYGVSVRCNGGDGIPTGRFGLTTSATDTYGIDDLTYIQNTLLNKWVHYSFVMCDYFTYNIPYTEQKIYINSEPLVLNQSAGSNDNGRRFINQMNFGTRIGNYIDRVATYNIALIKVYNRELTQAEVTQNFNAHKGRFNIY